MQRPSHPRQTDAKWKAETKFIEDHRSMASWRTEGRDSKTTLRLQLYIVPPDFEKQLLLTTLAIQNLYESKNPFGPIFPFENRQAYWNMEKNLYESKNPIGPIFPFENRQTYWNLEKIIWNYLQYL